MWERRYIVREELRYLRTYDGQSIEIWMSYDEDLLTYYCWYWWLVCCSVWELCRFWAPKSAKYLAGDIELMIFGPYLRHCCPSPKNSFEESNHVRGLCQVLRQVLGLLAVAVLLLHPRCCLLCLDKRQSHLQKIMKLGFSLYIPKSFGLGGHF